MPLNSLIVTHTCHRPVFSLSLHSGLAARTSPDVAVVKEILLEA